MTLHEPSFAFPLEVKKRIDQWLREPYDEQTKNTIRTLLIKDPHSLIDAFYCDLAFGTGGMRGLMGVGTNRLNIYTIQMATQGLAQYIKKQKPQEPLSVVIGFDSRNHSEEFAWQAAQVLAGNAIKVYLLTQLRPTPFVSFACRFKKADAAIMITASHNSKEYNGYKVYWSDGAQVVYPHDKGIVEEVESINSLHQVTLAVKHSALIVKLNDELDQPYLDAISPLQHFPESNREKGKTLTIAYTPLHGTGITLTPRALSEWGFSSIECVAAQSLPDGNFPTVAFPNPEYKEALELGIDLLMRSKADILIANDPDADRMGVVVSHLGNPVILNGNEVAAICIDFLCRVLTKQGKMPTQAAFVTTIVSSELLKTIAAAYGKPCFEVLTGFKYIGEKIHQWETASPSYDFLFGAEESYGYLIGTHARDKDAIVCSCLIAEIALDAKLQGHTLVDLLNGIYEKYGVFREQQSSITFKPIKEEIEKMQEIMRHLRENPPSAIAALPVLYIEDYERKVRLTLSDAKIERLTLPQSDVLVFRLYDNSRIVIRPSGTEPKVKIYVSANSPPSLQLQAAITNCDQHLNQLLKATKDLLNLLRN